jgi:hypothetical protein
MTRRPARTRRDRVEHVRLGDHHVAFYVGRGMIGEVLIGRTVQATDAAGRELGTFPNRQTAMSAVIAAHRGRP